MAEYNGHRSWNAWNVSLWINNDEYLYNLALECIALTATRARAARRFLDQVGEAKTPDGATFNPTCIIAAMRGM